MGYSEGLFWAYFYVTNTASSSSGKTEAGFWVIYFHETYPHLCGPYYIV